VGAETAFSYVLEDLSLKVGQLGGRGEERGGDRNKKERGRRRKRRRKGGEEEFFSSPHD